MLSSFTRRFFAEADAAIHDYAAGVLVDAAADGIRAADACSALEDFRSDSIPAAEFQLAVEELLACLRDFDSSAAPSWESHGGSTLQGCASAAEPPGQREGGPGCTTAGSKLRPHAPAFQPAARPCAPPSCAANVADATVVLDGLALSDHPQAADNGASSGGEVFQPAGDWEACPAGIGWEAPRGVVDNMGWGSIQQGTPVYPSLHAASQQDPHSPILRELSAHSISGSWSQNPTAALPAGAASFASLGSQGEHCLREGSAEQSAFLSVLSQQFPEYSDAVLRELLGQQGGSLEATVDMLCSMENELQGQVALGSPPQQEASSPAFDNNADFPSLPSPASPPARPGSAAGAAGATGYAAVVRASEGAAASAGSGTIAAARRAKPHAASAAAASPSTAKAPIWEARGVPQYATGTQVAAEYAAARETARDQAQLRNMYFQQATQAYLAGQRALAKELGEKGRWHGQQMRAAHSVAAAHIFSSRNQGVAEAVGAAGAGGVVTVDLHGLHVSEALERLEEVLLSLVPPSSMGVRTRRAAQLRVVVGVGQHGKVPARLPTAVRQYLRGQGLAVSEPYAGLLEVKLS